MGNQFGMSFPPVFGTEPFLTAAQIQRTEAYGSIAKFSDGETIHQRGDVALAIGVIKTGGISLSNVGRGGQRLTVVVIGPGESYGINSVFLNRPRTHDAAAIGDVQVVMIRRDSFRRMLQAEPDILDFYIAFLSDRLELALAILDDERRQPVKVRLAKLLLRLELSGTSSYSSTQTDLATQLGVSRNSVGANLSELAQLGLIEVHYRKVSIVDRKKLQNWVRNQEELAPLDR